MSRYMWGPPKAFVGDRVRVIDHRGAYRSGEVSYVETFYRHTGEAYHVFTITFDELKRARRLGSDQIIHVFQQDPTP